MWQKQKPTQQTVYIWQPTKLTVEVLTANAFPIDSHSAIINLDV